MRIPFIGGGELRVSAEQRGDPGKAAESGPAQNLHQFPADEQHQSQHDVPRHGQRHELLQQSPHQPHGQCQRQSSQGAHQG